MTSNHNSTLSFQPNEPKPKRSNAKNGATSAKDAEKVLKNRGQTLTMKKPRIRNVLVPVDFSALSIEAIQEAKKVAQASTATIHLAHVFHAQYPIGFMGPILTAGEPAVSFEEHQQKSFGEELEKVAQGAELPPSARTHLREGHSVFHEICQLAQEISADLIVMPTHGRTGFRHFFLGSTAERIVQHSPCPVLVTRARKTNNGQVAAKGNGRRPTILVPIDFSPASFESLEYAIGYAAGAGAKLLILNAVYLGDTLSTDGLGIYRMADFRQTARWDAEREMKEFLGPINFGEVPLEILIRNGKPAPEICSVANERSVNLIITGTHGRTGLKHLVMGSVAEQVVRSANQSVLVVPSHPEARQAGLERVVRYAIPLALTGREGGLVPAGAIRGFAKSSSRCLTV